MNFDLGNKTVLLPVKLDNEVLFSKAVQHRVRCVLAVDRDTQGSLTELSCGKHHRDSPRKTRYGAEDASALILFHGHAGFGAPIDNCLLYTSDAADDLLCVDLGGRRIIKKKNTHSPSMPTLNNT